MTATRPRPRGKRAFLTLLAAGSLAQAAAASDPGWRLVIIPAFERPALHTTIPGSHTAIIAAARPAELGLFEYATTRGALRWAADQGARHGEQWLHDAAPEIRRNARGIIDRILIRSDHPLASSVILTPHFYRQFEPLLGDGFHVIFPDRRTIALYPRLGGKIPPQEAAALLQTFLLSSHPVSREVFRATPDGLVADGILAED